MAVDAALPLVLRPHQSLITGGSQMRNLLVLFAFVPMMATAAPFIRTNCRPDTSNVLLNTCECDIQDKADSSYSGFALFACSQLSCEEFESNQKPQGCDDGMRGVTCWVAQPATYSCPMMIPRVAGSIKAKELCQAAVDDVNKKGPSSAYYNKLDYALCSPAGYSQPPFYGWIFTGSFVDGWD
jgi:hypothetical protein